MSARPASLASLLIGLALVAAGCGDDGGDRDGPATGGEEAPAAAGDARGGEERDPGGQVPEESEPAGEGPEHAAERRERRLIATAIRDVLASGDPGLACADAVTARYVERGYGSGQSCRLAQEPETVAETVEVGQIEVRGDRATAVARPDGGLYDGMELDAGLVYEAGAWRLDELSADVPAGP